MRLQRGGFVMGLIIGLLAGLALALGVALYVTKVPVPFINKVPQRTAEQDAAEVEKNKNWDPNGPLYGKNPAKPSATAPASTGSGALTPPAEPAVAATPPLPGVPLVSPRAASAAAARAPGGNRDAAAILSDRSAPNAAPSPATGADVVVSTKPGVDPFSYFVQAGAYARTEEAEQQRAKLAMLGFTARVTEREQAGRTVYRVRVGPFDKKDDADATKDKLDGSGVESALVRIQK